MLQKFKQRYSIKCVALICIIVIFNILVLPRISYAATYNQTVKSGIENFPIEYQDYLYKLKELHPNWSFDAYYTGISWEDFLNNETDHGHNRIINNVDASWKCSCGNIASGYACASKSIIEYYADPRNFLNEVNVFQFLEISYNSSVHNLSGIEAIIKNTFMNNRVQCVNKQQQSINMTYAEIILEAAKKSNMSPYSIATKIIQEVGTNGSGSITGNYPGYVGYYNFYNYGAYDSGNAISNGLQYAKNQGWNNQYDAIIEGACLLANSYTNAGQNTAYFYKWDVVGNSILKSGYSQNVTSSDLFRHQYMTNIQDPMGQSNTLYNTYVRTNVIDGNLNFVIPIYTNMPSTNKLPTELTSNDGELYYVNCTDGLFVRSEPNTSGTILSTLYKDTTVAVLQKDCSTDSSGRVWSKIKLSNGIIGYTASQYLTSSNDNNSSKTTENVIGNAHTTDPLKLRSLATTSSVMLLIIPQGEEVAIIQKNVADSDGYTWYKVKYNNTIGYVASNYLRDISEVNELNNNITSIDNVDQYSKGDVNGDSRVSPADYVLIKNSILGEMSMTEQAQKAADVNQDGKISPSDYVLVKNYILNGEW